MSSKFKRKIENFVCDVCKESVEGDGYTNHCPRCLWSKHVDNNPGDRASDCGGLMEPITAEESGGEWSLVHKCQKCGKLQKNKTSSRDNFHEVIRISSGN